MLRSRTFALLAVALGLTSLTSYVVVVNLVPLLGERGIGPGTAALVLGIGGVGQVLGRLGYAPLARRLGVRARTLVVLTTVAVSTGLLGMLTWLPALIAVAVLAGMVRGIVTLLQATAVTDRWGARDYGTLSGVLAAPLTFTTAVAPFLGAALAGAVRQLRHHARGDGRGRAGRRGAQPRVSSSPAACRSTQRLDR